MKMIVVEDDFRELAFMTAHLSKEFPGADIEAFETEHAFRNAIEMIRKNPPHVVIIDIMLRWADPQDELMPAVAFDGGYQRAGVRCQELLASFPETAGVPIVFYSVLERVDVLPDGRLPSNTLFSTKGGELFDLTRKVRSLIAAQQRMPSPAIAKDKVFISYSHKDKKFLDELLVHMKPLERAGRLSHWSDRQLKPGGKWFDEITQALKSSKVVVMLLTSSFLASDFIHEFELAPVLKEAEAGGVKILWILVRACSYQHTALRNYQAVLPLDKPLAEMKAERDRAWVAICKEIEKAAS
jgi:hypothetical protein